MIKCCLKRGATDVHFSGADDIPKFFSVRQVQYIAQMVVCYNKFVYIYIKREIYCTMKYGDLIKERRALLGLTQQDLSDYTGLSIRIIKSVEAQNGNPTLSTLEKIADVLGLEVIMRIRRVNE